VLNRGELCPKSLLKICLLFLPFDEHYRCFQQAIDLVGIAFQISEALFDLRDLSS
jgi:hypothetical protein